MNNEATGRELAERINRAHELLTQDGYGNTCDRVASLRDLFDGPVACAETSDDILAELAKSADVTLNNLAGNPQVWIAATPSIVSDPCATPLDALKALRARLIPAEPVPMTQADFDEIAELIRRTAYAPDDEAGAACANQTIKRLHRHVKRDTAHDNED